MSARVHRWILRVSLVALCLGGLGFIVGISPLATSGQPLMFGVMCLIVGLGLRAISLAERLLATVLGYESKFDAAFAIFSPKDQGACPSCGEHVDGVTGPFCPKCGTVIPVRDTPADGG